MKTEVLRMNPKTRLVYLRDSILAVFFFPPPIHESVDALRTILNDYVTRIPDGALTWSAVGATAEEWSPVKPSTLASCHRLLQPAPAMKRRMTAFRLTDGEGGGDAPGYAFCVEGEPSNDNLIPESACSLQFSVPMEDLDERNVEDFVAFVRQASERLAYTSGYVSPVVRYAELETMPGTVEAVAFAIRHPGYDLEDNIAARLRLGQAVRGARWLTFLSPDLAARVGGAGALRESLPKDVAVEPLRNGVMIRAGILPEIGDTNRAQDTPLLRAVAKVLEPITAFGELAVLGQIFNRDTEALRDWERRFLD